MDLTSELLMDFIDQSRKYVKKRLPEHRKAGRLALSAEVQILVGGASNAKDLLQTTASNLSASGVALLVPKKLSPGQEFCVRLPCTQGGVRWLRCEVTRWQTSSTGLMSIAARFCDLVCTDTGEIPMLIDLGAVISEASAHMRTLCKQLMAVDADLDQTVVEGGAKEGAVQSELRRVKRATMRFDSTATLLPRGKGSVSVSIHILDISTGGVGFVCRKQFVKGSRLAFIVRFSDKKAKAILAKVVGCTPIGATQFRTGAEFIEACDHPPENPSLPTQWMDVPTAAVV